MKYQRFAPSGCKDIGIRRFEFLAKTQFLSDKKNDFNSAEKGEQDRAKHLTHSLIQSHFFSIFLSRKSLFYTSVRSGDGISVYL